MVISSGIRNDKCNVCLVVCDAGLDIIEFLPKAVLGGFWPSRFRCGEFIETPQRFPMRDIQRLSYKSGALQVSAVLRPVCTGCPNQ